MFFFKENEHRENWFWEVKEAELEGMYKLETDTEQSVIWIFALSFQHCRESQIIDNFMDGF